MKRRLDDHHDIIASSSFNYAIRGVGKEVGCRLVTPVAATHIVTKSTGSESKPRNMQSSIQYPMQSYQITTGISQSGGSGGGSSNSSSGGGGNITAGGVVGTGGQTSTSLSSAVHLQHHSLTIASHHASTPITGHTNSVAAPTAVHSPSGAQQQQIPQQQFQRLKVEDALSYLDQVKFKFGNNPQVYNDFLDIMKEFKSQSIDTPGVIQRVSHLFKGHPELIVGFNTFLPPGYKIEIQANDQVNVCVPGSSTVTILHPPSTNVSVPSLPLSSSQKTSGHHAPPSAVQSSPVISHSQQPSAATPQHSYHQPPQQQHSSQLSSSSVSSPIHSQPPTANQPVEFNHAINYVNKIKNRFQGQPDIYKQFLEILHTYQKEQRNLKEGITSGTKPLTEAEVYQQVAKLFQNQEDLLQEFGQFLPDANGTTATLVTGDVWNSINNKTPRKPMKTVNNDHTSAVKKPLISKPCNNLSSNSGSSGNAAVAGSGSVGGGSSSSSNNQTKHVIPLKRPTVSGPSLPNKVSSSGPPFGQTKVISSIKRPSSSVGNRSPPSKKPKLGTLKDITLAEAGKYGTIHEFTCFEKVKKAFKSSEVYDNFLRCVTLFNNEIISRSELVQLITPFLGKYPEIFKWFKDFLGHKEGGPLVEPVPSRVANQERIGGDLAMEIDYSTCRRLGASYCALPKTCSQPKCSGRTQLCREVLNDTWVSFPSWSEDSTFVSSRKTQYEEYIYRCEDERFELDVVLESNLATIRVLEGVQKKMSRMTPDELTKFRLDDSLGGTSQVIHHRTVKRIYGDKAPDIIDGLKRNPAVAVPLVLRRLKAKEEEWREAQKNFNKIWRDQNEKYYLKSLDHQGINFKQNDVKSLRSKSFLNDIEAVCEERREQSDEGSVDVQCGPHIAFVYKDKSILDDAANLIIHHVKRQTGIHKDDKRKIKHLIKQFIPDLFFHARQDLSDDEKDEEEPESNETKSNHATSDGSSDSKRSQDYKETAKSVDDVYKSLRKYAEDVNTMLPNGDVRNCDSNSKNLLEKDNEEAYTLFMANNNWYLFFRLHQVLCERLITIYRRSVIIASEEARDRKDRKESIAESLLLKPKCDIDIEEYYPSFIDMVKNLLDGNMESNTYEDTLREMFGIHAYIAFTLDKVVQSVVRQLQHIVCDETCIQCTEVFLEEQKNNATGGLVATSTQRAVNETAYQKKMEQILSEENCFKIFVYKPECRLTVELVGTETNNSEDVLEMEKFNNYNNFIEKFTSASNDESMSEVIREHLYQKPILLKRNCRRRPAAIKQNNEKEDSSTGDDSAGSQDKKDEYPRDMEITDNTQCKINPSNIKMVYVVKSETFLVKKTALARARTCHKKISDKLYSKFGRWHKEWVRSHVTDEQQRQNNEWLMGKCDGQIENNTILHRDNDLARPPYHPYSRYRVEWLERQT
ncbi:Paired amphipathic helix protein Sin3b [Chamberlinius hualienensis]